MYVLITHKDEKNQMKNEGARVVTTLYSYILDAQVQLTLYPFKTESQKISHCKSMQIFYNTQGQLTQQF